MLKSKDFRNEKFLNSPILHIIPEDNDNSRRTLKKFRKQITNLYKDEYHYICPDNFNILLSIPTTDGASSKYRNTTNLYLIV